MKKLISCSGYVSLILFLMMVKAVNAETQEVIKETNQQRMETGTLTGVVLDKKTGGPVVAATVMVMKTQRGAATDLNGKFTLTNIPVGTHRVLVSQLGYRVHVKDVTFSKGQSMDLRFQLEPSKEGTRQEWGPGRATELSDEDKEYFIAVESLPEPIGGIAAIQANVIYPEIARRAGIQGTVYVEVFLSERGEVDRAIVKKGIGAGCDEAAIIAVKKVKFRPGTQRGEPVKVRMSIPIRFRLGPSAKQVEENLKQYSNISKPAILIVSGPQGIRKHIEYPPEAIEKNLQGVVHVDVMLRNDNLVKGMTLRQGVSYGIDKDVMSAIQGYDFFKDQNFAKPQSDTTFSVVVQFILPQKK